MNARANCLSGIVNGIDYEDYNPIQTISIVKKLRIRISGKRKSRTRQRFRKNLDLEKNHKTMMIGIVSRLTDQKGFDLVAYVMDELCQDAVQIVALGTGEEQYENMFRHFAWKYPDKVSANIYYSEEMSHKDICIL